MAAEHSASSQRRSYADQYLGRGAKSTDPETEPYGYWYAERLRRSGESARALSGGAGQPYREDPADFSRHREPGAAAQAQDAALADPAAPDGETALEPDTAHEHEAAPAHATDAPEPEPDWTPAPDPGEAPVPRAPAASLSPATLRQLEQNADQLSLVEGNLVAAAKQEVTSVYVTSCFRGEGKTTAALSAAYGLAAMSQGRVLLVDAGNAAARLHGMLAVTPYPGLNEVLEGQVALADALHPTSGLPGLHLLACGAVSRASLSEAQRAERIKAFLDAVKPHYDFVVVDGASTFASSDPARLAACFDGVMFVVACERTKWEVVQGAVEKIRSGGGRVLGGVLNRRRFYIPRMIYQWISR